MLTQRRSHALGLVGAILVAAAGFAVEKMPAAAAHLVSWIRDTATMTPGRVCWLAVSVVGIGLMCYAWIALLRLRLPSPEGVHAARRAAWLWSLPLLLTPPLFSHDGWSYVAQGALTANGIDPYTHGPSAMPEAMTSMVDFTWRDTPAPYGPVPLTYGALIAQVVNNPYVAMVLFRLPIIATLVLLAWAMPRVARSTGMDEGRLSLFVVASPYVILHGTAGLHSDLIVAAMVAVGYVLAYHKRWVLASFLVAVAASIKVTAIVALIPIVLIALPVATIVMRRVLTFAAATAVVLLGMVVLGLPYGLGFGWVKALDVPGLIVSATSPPTAVGLLLRALAPEGTTLDLHAVEWCRSAGMVLAVVIGAYVALRTRTGESAYALRAGAIAFGAIIGLGPVWHPWYFFLMIPFASAVIRTATGAKIVIVTLVVICLTATINNTLHGVPILVVEAIALAIVLTWLVSRFALRGSRSVATPTGVELK